MRFSLSSKWREFSLFLISFALAVEEDEEDLWSIHPGRTRFLLGGDTGDVGDEERLLGGEEFIVGSLLWRSSSK